MKRHLAVERHLQIINPLGRFSQGLTDLTSGEGFPGNAEELATGLTSCISGEGFPEDPEELATGLATGPSSPIMFHNCLLGRDLHAAHPRT